MERRSDYGTISHDAEGQAIAQAQKPYPTGGGSNSVVAPANGGGGGGKRHAAVRYLSDSKGEIQPQYVDPPQAADDVPSSSCSCSSSSPSSPSSSFGLGIGGNAAAEVWTSPPTMRTRREELVPTKGSVSDENGGGDGRRLARPQRGALRPPREGRKASSASETSASEPAAALSSPALSTSSSKTPFPPSVAVVRTTSEASTTAISEAGSTPFDGTQTQLPRPSAISGNSRGISFSTYASIVTFASENHNDDDYDDDDDEAEKTGWSGQYRTTESLFSDSEGVGFHDDEDDDHGGELKGSSQAVAFFCLIMFPFVLLQGALALFKSLHEGGDGDAEIEIGNDVNTDLNFESSESDAELKNWTVPSA